MLHEFILKGTPDEVTNLTTMMARRQKKKQIDAISGYIEFEETNRQTHIVHIYILKAWNIERKKNCKIK